MSTSRSAVRRARRAIACVGCGKPSTSYRLSTRSTCWTCATQAPSSPKRSNGTGGRSERPPASTGVRGESACRGTRRARDEPQSGLHEDRAGTRRCSRTTVRRFEHFENPLPETLDVLHVLRHGEEDDLVVHLAVFVNKDVPETPHALEDPVLIIRQDPRARELVE